MKQQKEIKDWFKLKRYPHIGFPIEAKERAIWVEDFVRNVDKVKEHSFLPFIHKKSKVRKYRKKYSDEDGKPIFSVIDEEEIIARYSDVKERELYYAGHLDSLVFSFYSEQISDLYNEALNKNGLTDVVTAYRKIPITKAANSPNKCNIDFALDIFNAIKQYPQEKFVVLAFDIKGFFDNLNHLKLRKKWAAILNLEKLPDDHFNVYKHITRFTYVDLVDIFETFKNRIFVRSSSHQKATIRRKRISKIKYLKKQKAVAFCTKEEYIKLATTLTKKDKWVKDNEGAIVLKDYGIPQGSPISSVLANLYMLDFDKKINDYVAEFGGIYRRYSDDMIVICPLLKKDDVIEKFKEEISEEKLEIQSKKTQIFHFERKNNILSCSQEFSTSLNANKNLIYLGLEFDGMSIRVRSASMSGFYRKMKRTIKRAKHFANHPAAKNNQIFKARILKRFSYKGAQRRRKYVWNKKENYFEISHHYDWGNFLSYTGKAQKIKFNNTINKQTKKHWAKLNELLNS